MRPPVLWIYFLGDAATNDQRPTVWVGEGRDGYELALSERARALIGALAVPPKMAAGSSWASSELSTWRSAEVVERMGYEHRRAIQDAIGDLGDLFAEHDLELGYYLYADKRSGRYGLNNVYVDAVEVLRRQDDPQALDALLSTYTADPASTGFATASKGLWSRAVRTQVAEALAAAARRAGRATGEQASGDANMPTSHAEASAIGDGPAAGQALEGPVAIARDRHRRRLLVGGTAGVIAVAIVVVLVAVLVGGSGDGSGGGATTSGGPGLTEVPGGLAHAWSDYTSGGGKQGVPLRTHVAVRVSCRVRGLRVDDGNVWWYRIASEPWNGRFYATADAFYNNGHRTGPLRRTPFFDPRVAICR